MAAGLYRLHHTRLKPSYLALNIGPIDAVPRHAGRRTRPCCCTHLLSSRIDGSANSLVRRDYEEVCRLCRNKKFFDPFPTIGRGKAARGHKALWSSHSGNPYCDRATTTG